MNANGLIAAGASNGVDQTMLTKQGAGRYSLDLGVDSTSDGLLFAIGNNNSNTVVQTEPLAGGNGWALRVQNNAAEFSATGIDRDFSFVYLPYDTIGLVGGLYDGSGDAHLSSVGDFTMTRLDAGQYELAIPGESPDTGMLILTVADSFNNGVISAPNDKVLTYEPSGTGTFLINSVDLPSVALEDARFAWAFISFDNPISQVPEPGTVGIVIALIGLAAVVRQRATAEH